MRHYLNFALLIILCIVLLGESLSALKPFKDKQFPHVRPVRVLSDALLSLRPPESLMTGAGPASCLRFVE